MCFVKPCVLFIRKELHFGTKTCNGELIGLPFRPKWAKLTHWFKSPCSMVRGKIIGETSLGMGEYDRLIDQRIQFTRRIALPNRGTQCI